jgi:hypothetical protein
MSFYNIPAPVLRIVSSTPSSDRQAFLEEVMHPGDLVFIAPRLVPDNKKLKLPQDIKGFKPANKLTDSEWYILLSAPRWSQKRFGNLLFIIPRRESVPRVSVNLSVVGEKVDSQG